ncbi:MAG: ribosome small subunit-dependent GTPase A, partial [Chloroflexi bacterium]|nr:ribosome small subunit-dependent GTPase A [Chloroflexota bacterium]
MTQKQTQHQIRAVKKMLATKGRRQQLKELKSGRPLEQRPKSRAPRRKDWDADDEDYFTSEKIRRAEKIKAGPPQAVEVIEREPEVTGTVIEIRSGDSLVMYEGRTVRAMLPAGARSVVGMRSPLAVGDRVELGPGPSGAAYITHVATRRSALSRDATIGGGPETAHVLAANVDQIVIVCSPKEPPFRPGLIDRYLVAASRDGLPAVVCLNKTDLTISDEVEVALRGYEALGIDVLRTSAVAGAGLESARAQIAGKVSLFTGHSGVGKSSLLNALEPGLALRVGDVTQATAGQGKGTHTTSSARLIPLSLPETF